MKISRNHLAVIAAASKDDSRPVLNAIQVYSEGKETVSVATDSYRLYEVREPFTEGEEHDANIILLPLNEAKFAQTIIKPHPELTHLDLTPESMSVNGTTHKIKLQEGKFPEYKKFVERKEAQATIKLDPKYLKEAMEFFKGAISVTIEFHGLNEAVVVRAGESYEDQANKVAVIMPMRG